jgi:hypothetical protein
MASGVPLLAPRKRGGVSSNIVLVRAESSPFVLR